MKMLAAVLTVFAASNALASSLEIQCTNGKSYAIKGVRITGYLNERNQYVQAVGYVDHSGKVYGDIAALVGTNATVSCELRSK